MAVNSKLMLINDIYHMFKKKRPFLYNKLLHEMGHYFPDTQYVFEIKKKLIFYLRFRHFYNGF